MGRGAAGAGPEPVATAKRGETGWEFGYAGLWSSRDSASENVLTTTNMYTKPSNGSAIIPLDGTGDAFAQAGCRRDRHPEQFQQSEIGQ